MKLLTTQQLAEIKRPKWLIEDFVAEKSTTMIYGPWGLGKSFLALDLAATASTGADWHGRKVERPLKTLFIVAEGAAWWYRRLLAYEKVRGPVDREMLFWVPEPVDLFHEKAVNKELAALEAAVAQLQPDMLIIDTWVRCSAAYGMNEDKATDTAQAYKNLDYLRDTYNVTPVIVHHPTKSGGFRGSGNQGASVERIIALEAHKESAASFIVNDEKGNHTEPFPPFVMTFESVDLSEFVPAGEDFELSSAVVHYEGPLDPSAGKEKNSAKLWNVFRAITSVGDEWSAGQFKGLKVLPSGSVGAALKELVKEGKLENNEGMYRRLK